MAELNQREGKSVRKAALFGLTVASVLLSSCGPELTRISVLDNLRIIALKKSAPYARPGEKVKLSLFWEDGSKKAPRNVDRFIGFWCVNPLGDLYAGCLSAAANVTPQFALNQDEFEITIPTDAVRKSTSDPNLPPYGLAYVFYAACAGKLVFGGADGGAAGAAGATSGPGVGPASLPVCITDAGEVAEGNDYIIGYSAIYIYDDFRNENPLLTGFRVAGQDVKVDCIGTDCTGRFDKPVLTGCEPGVACIDACADDGDVTCPEVPIQPIIDKKSVEEDSVSKVAYGDDYEEGLWASYFVDRGSLNSEVRLVNDPTTGFNEEYETKFFAPKEKGPLRIWAVVRDNRGGVNWVRIPAYVK